MFFYFNVLLAVRHSGITMRIKLFKLRDHENKNKIIQSFKLNAQKNYIFLSICIGTGVYENEFKFIVIFSFLFNKFKDAMIYLNVYSEK